VSLAAWYAAPATTYPDARTWSGHVIWGNRMIEGPGVTPDAVSWSLGSLWGDPAGSVLGSLHNVVWGLRCGGADCATTWTTSDTDGDTVVWGTGDTDGDTVVWGTSDTDGDTVVWGTSCADPSCDTVVWGRQ
jgi:hypothetical protein